MAKLDLFKERKKHSITAGEGEDKEELDFPADFTLEEEERILELQSELEHLKEGEEEVPQEKQYDIILEQITILAQRYQPEITSEYLKEYLTRRDCDKIINWLAEQRLEFIKDDMQKQTQDAKKKLEQAQESTSETSEE